MKRSLCALSVMVMLTTATTASADSPLNPTKSMHDNLQALTGAKQMITVVLKSGKEYRARVGAVGDKAVMLTDISGREFFDVLVPLKAIVAIEAQARQQ